MSESTDNPVIATHSLSKTYYRWLGFRSTQAVIDLSFSVQPGSTFGFLGPNGAGKTTTIKMLLGLVHPTRGKGHLLGRPLGDERARREVGFLPEEPAFSRHLKGRAFLKLCAKLSEVPADQQAARIDAALDVVGLAHRAGHRLSDYSRGMLQRIGIAQALLHDPKLLILDEPMTGLDPPGRREIKSIILDLANKGKTIFFSSHILSDVQELCDEVGILNHGRLVLNGRLDDLLGSSGVDITVCDLPAGQLEAIEPLVDSMSKQGQQWTLQLNDETRKDAVFKALRQGGCADLQVTPRRESLDDLFMKTIEDDNQTRKENTHG
jgi:ABC-2 type transport system ATP-binding protein